MPATRTDTFLSPPITQQNLYDAIKQAFVNAGFTAPFDEYTSGTDKVVIYRIILDASKTFGTSYLRIRLTTGFTIGQQLYSTWAVATHTGSNPSGELIYTALSNSQINFTSLNGGAEYNMVFLTQGSNYFVLGHLTPFYKPIWWDLNAWNYCFVPASTLLSPLRSTALNPLGNTDNDAVAVTSGRLALQNPVTNRRDIFPGLIYCSAANTGIVGRASDDFVIIYGSGTSRYDILQVPGSSEQYLVIWNATGGVAIRIG